jgi:hypothetical protein
VFAVLLQLKTATSSLYPYRPCHHGLESRPVQNHILNPQADAFHQAHPGSVQHIRHQPIHTAHPHQYFPTSERVSSTGKRCGRSPEPYYPATANQSPTPPCTKTVAPTTLGFASKQTPRLQPPDALKTPPPPPPHFLGMTFVMKQDKPFDPLHILRFRTEAIVLDTDTTRIRSRSLGGVL